MLRNDKLNLFIKYGLNGASHAHPDILNIEDICELDKSEIKLTDENLKLYLSFIIPPNSKLYMMKTLDNPVTKKRTSFLIRSNEKSPTFKMKLKCKEL